MVTTNSRTILQILNLSRIIKRIREEQPKKEGIEKKEEETSSLALTTIHQDEAAVLHALVEFSLFSALPTVMLFSRSFR